mgnify:CR=1 FL=1
MIRLSCFKPVADPAFWSGRNDREVYVELAVSEWINGGKSYFKVGVWYNGKVGREITFKTYDEALQLYVKLQEDVFVWEELLTQHGLHGVSPQIE